MKNAHRLYLALALFNGCYCAGCGTGTGTGSGSGCGIGSGSSGSSGCVFGAKVASSPDMGVVIVDAGADDAGDAGGAGGADAGPPDSGTLACNFGFTSCGGQCVSNKVLTLRYQSTTPVGFAPTSMAIGRMNADRLGDIAAVGGPNGAVLLGNPAGGPFFIGQSLNGPNGNPTQVRLGALDGGGPLDVAMSHAGSARATLFYGRGDGTFGGAVTVAMGQLASTAAGFALGDFNGDHRLDLLGASFPSDLGVAASTGSGYQPPSSYAGLYVPRGAAVGDFDHDGRLDAVVATMGFGGASIAWGDGDAGFSGHRELGLTSDGNAVVAADFNRDGWLDVALLDSSFTVQVVYAAADGGFRAPSPLTLGGDYLVTGDFDGDGYPDLATARAQQVSVALNPAGFVSPRQLPIRPGSVDATSSSLAAGDLNGDFIDDLAIGNSYHLAIEALVTSCP